MMTCKEVASLIASEGEKRMQPRNYTNGQDELDLAPIVGGVVPNRYVRLGNSDPKPTQDSGRCEKCHEFGGPHTAAWNAVMTDGSVRSLAYSMDGRNHSAFSSIDAGDIIQDVDN